MPSGIGRGAVPCQHPWATAASVRGHWGVLLLPAALSWLCLEWDLAPPSSGTPSLCSTLALGAPSLSELPLASSHSFLDLYL